MFFKNFLFILFVFFAFPLFAITVEDINKLHKNYGEDNTILLQKFEEIEPQIISLPIEEQNKIYEHFFIDINSNEKFYNHYKNYILKDDLKSQYINFYISYYFNDIEKLEESLLYINKFNNSNIKSIDLSIFYSTVKSIIRNKQGAYYESLLILEEAEKLVSSSAFIKTKISFLNNKAVIYYYLKDFKNSNEYNKKIIELYKNNKIEIDLTYVYTLNNMYYNAPKESSNLKFIKNELNNLILKNNNKNILALSYFIYGLTISGTSNPIKYYDKAIQLYTELNIQEDVFYTKIQKGKYLAERNYPEELKKILDEIFDENSNNKHLFKMKANYYRQISDYKNALKYLEIYKNKQGEDFNKKFTVTVEDLKVMFDTVNKEESNLNLVQDKKIKEYKIKEEKELALEKNKQLFYSFLVLSVILFIIITFVYFYRKMKEEATIDDLTKIYNRKSIMAIGEHAFDHYEKAFSIILFDIDYFKNINDKYGHDIGDKVLTEFSQLIKKELRKDDFFGRYGGEEFLIISQAPLLLADEMAQRLRKTIMEYQFDCADLKITSSFGVVSYYGHNNFEEMLKDADHMLYLAKNQGRNKVVKKETR